MSVLDDCPTVYTNDLYTAFGYYACECLDEKGRYHLYVEEGLKDEYREYVVTITPSGEYYFTWFDYKKEPHEELSTYDYVLDVLGSNEDDLDFYVVKIGWLMSHANKGKE